MKSTLNNRLAKKLYELHTILLDRGYILCKTEPNQLTHYYKNTNHVWVDWELSERMNRVALNVIVNQESIQVLHSFRKLCRLLKREEKKEKEMYRWQMYKKW